MRARCSLKHIFSTVVCKALEIVAQSLSVFTQLAKELR